jgi:hypothetical protein
MLSWCFCALGGAGILSTQASAESFGALNEPPEAGRRAAEEAAAQVEADLRAGKIEQVARRGLDAAVRGALALLRQQGHKGYADRMETQWEQRFAPGAMNLLELGDHEPLNRWLADFYGGIEARVDEKWLNLFLISDIKVFNFGIPVAVRPKGNPKTGEEWGAPEYKLHFVPVAAASTYWIANIACSVAVPMPASLGCGIAAWAPRYAMLRFIAPPLSDKIYAKANPAQ